VTVTTSSTRTITYSINSDVKLINNQKYSIQLTDIKFENKKLNFLGTVSDVYSGGQFITYTANGTSSNNRGELITQIWVVSEPEPEPNTITYSTSNGITTATFKGTGPLNSIIGLGQETTVVIIEGYSSIGSYVFQSATHVTSVTISASVESIGNSAFVELSNLTTVKFEAGSKLNTIEEQAFLDTGLTSIIIPKSVTKIGTNAFKRSKNLESVTFEAGSILETIVLNTFYEATSLTSIIIPSSVKTIGQSAFYGCTELESIDIPNTVENIGDYTFYECNKLKNINEYNIMPTSIKALGERVFKNTLIESIMFMMDNYNNLTETSFDQYAFSDSNITSFTMSEGIAKELGVSFNSNSAGEYGAFDISFYGKSNVNIYSSLQDIVQPVITVPGVHFLL